jgi:hypothetical protein
MGLVKNFLGSGMCKGYLKSFLGVTHNARWDYVGPT